MPQTKWMQSMVKKYGSEEAVRSHMSEIAKEQRGSKKPNSGVASLTEEEKSRRGVHAANKRWGNK